MLACKLAQVLIQHHSQCVPIRIVNSIAEVQNHWTSHAIWSFTYQEVPQGQKLKKCVKTDKFSCSLFPLFLHFSNKKRVFMIGTSNRGFCVPLCVSPIRKISMGWRKLSQKRALSDNISTCTPFVDIISMGKKSLATPGPKPRVQFGKTGLWYNQGVKTSSN